METVRLVAGWVARREFQAAGSHTEGLSLFRNVQQLYLSARQNEVTVKLLWGSPPPFPITQDSSHYATELTFPLMLQL